jgi:hypothetical protein
MTVIRKGLNIIMREKAALSGWRSWGYCHAIALAQIASGAGLDNKLVRLICQGDCPDHDFNELLAREPGKANLIADLRARIKAEQRHCRDIEAAPSRYRARL